MVDPTSQMNSALEKSVTLEAITRIADESERIITRLQSGSPLEEAGPSVQGKGYTITEVARMIGKTADGIRKAEKQGVE